MEHTAFTHNMKGIYKIWREELVPVRFYSDDMKPVS